MTVGKTIGRWRRSISKCKANRCDWSKAQECCKQNVSMACTSICCTCPGDHRNGATAVGDNVQPPRRTLPQREAVAFPLESSSCALRQRCQPGWTGYRQVSTPYRALSPSLSTYPGPRSLYSVPGSRAPTEQDSAVFDAVLVIFSPLIVS